MIELTKEQMGALIDELVASATREVSLFTKGGNPITLKIEELNLGENS